MKIDETEYQMPYIDTNQLLLLLSDHTTIVMIIVFMIYIAMRAIIAIMSACYVIMIRVMMIG